MKRKKIPSKKSKKLFTKTAQGSHKKNSSGTSSAMRGGIRL